MGVEVSRSGLTLSFKDTYADYGTFMEASRDSINRTILRAFNELKEKDTVKINVLAIVENTEFESELEFTKSNLDILTDVVNPYFEEIEEYEKCTEVMKILSELQD